MRDAVIVEFALLSLRYFLPDGLLVRRKSGIQMSICVSPPSSGLSALVFLNSLNIMQRAGLTRKNSSALFYMSSTLVWSEWATRCSDGVRLARAVRRMACSDTLSYSDSSPLQRFDAKGNHAILKDR